MAEDRGGGMDRAELKKHIKYARDEAVQVAFAIGKDGEAVIHMHRRKAGRALEKELKEAVPDSKDHRWGTLQMDPDDPKLGRVVLNKAASGLSRKLGKALRGTGCEKVWIMLEDGTEIDLGEEEDPDASVQSRGAPASPDEDDGFGDEEDLRPAADDAAGRAMDDAPPRRAAGMEDIPVSPRMGTPPRGSGMGDGPASPQMELPPGKGGLPGKAGQPDAKALIPVLSGLVKRMMEAMKQDSSQRAELTQLAVDAQASLRNGDLAQAAAGIDVLRMALDDLAPAGATGRGDAAPGPAAHATPAGKGHAAAAAPPAPPAGIALPAGMKPHAPPSGNHGATHPAAPIISKAKAAWTATRQRIEADLAKMTKQLEAALSDHDMADELAASCKARVDGVLHHLDEALSHKLDEINKAPDPVARGKLVEEAHQLIARYTGHIGTDPTIKELDGNPFVPLSIAKTLTGTLMALSRSIA